MDISERTYFSEEETTFPQIIAGLQSGEFELWNRGPNGEQWFRRVEAGLKTIRGIPAPERTAADFAGEMIEGDDDDELTDDELYAMSDEELLEGIDDEMEIDE